MLRREFFFLSSFHSVSEKNLSVYLAHVSSSGGASMITAAPRPYPASTLNLFTLATILGLMVAFGVVFFGLQDRQTGLYPLYLLMLIQLTPFLICFTRQDYDYLCFILFNHFFSYSIAKYNQLKTFFRTNDLYPEALHAIQELTFCTILMIVGYYGTRWLFFNQPRKKEKFQMLSLSRWQLITISCYVIFVPVFLRFLPSWFLAFHFATMGADMMLLLCSNSPGNDRLSGILRLGVFISTIWYFVTTGALSMVGALAAYVFIAACIRRNYKLLIFPLLLTLVGSLIQNVKMQYRVALGENPYYSTVERFELLGTLLAMEYLNNETMGMQTDMDPNEPDTGVDDKFLHGFARVGDDSLEQVLSWTPKKVPFWGGETYQHIPFMFIPRFLWPDKPSRHIWNKFGREYGYLSSDDYGTSVGVSYLAEAYMNFGKQWMYCLAFLFGIFAIIVEHISYKILKGHFSFTFMVFLIPLQWYAADVGSILNSIFIVAVGIGIFRVQFLKMARKDEYS